MENDNEQKQLLSAAEILDKWRNKWEEIPTYLRTSYPYNWYYINAMEEYAAQFTQPKQQDSAGVWVKASGIEHELKTWSKYFQEVVSGNKTFEVRKNDRNFQIGDILVLKEWNPTGFNSVSPNTLEGSYTGNEIRVIVTYIFKALPHESALFGINSDTCIMGIKHEHPQPKQITDASIEAMAEKEYPEISEGKYSKDVLEFCNSVISIAKCNYIKGAKAIKAALSNSADNLPRVEVENLLHTILNCQFEINHYEGLRESIVKVYDIETCFHEYFGINKKEPEF